MSKVEIRDDIDDEDDDAMPIEIAQQFVRTSREPGEVMLQQFHSNSRLLEQGSERDDYRRLRSPSTNMNSSSSSSRNSSSVSTSKRRIPSTPMQPSSSSRSSSSSSNSSQSRSEPAARVRLGRTLPYFFEHLQQWHDSFMDLHDDVDPKKIVDNRINLSSMPAYLKQQRRNAGLSLSSSNSRLSTGYGDHSLLPNAKSLMLNDNPHQKFFPEYDWCNEHKAWYFVSHPSKHETQFEESCMLCPKNLKDHLHPYVLAAMDRHGHLSLNQIQEEWRNKFDNLPSAQQVNFSKDDSDEGRARFHRVMKERAEVVDLFIVYECMIWELARRARERVFSGEYPIFVPEEEEGENDSDSNRMQTEEKKKDYLSDEEEGDSMRLIASTPSKKTERYVPEHKLFTRYKQDATDMRDGIVPRMYCTVHRRIGDCVMERYPSRYHSACMICPTKTTSIMSSGVSSGTHRTTTIYNNLTSSNPSSVVLTGYTPNPKANAGNAAAGSAAASAAAASSASMRTLNGKSNRFPF